MVLAREVRVQSDGIFHEVLSGGIIAARAVGMVALAVTAISTLGASSAWAQNLIPPPKPYEAVDGNNVNVSDGSLSVPIGSVTIGPVGMGELSDIVTYDTAAGYWRHSMVGVITRNPVGGPLLPTTWYTVSVLGQSSIFTRNIAGNYVLLEGDGGTLISRSGGYTYTSKNGAVAEFSSSIRNLRPYSSNVAAITSISRPNGEQLEFHYNVQASTTWQRLQAVTNNFGYQLHLQYATDGIGADWYRVVSVTALNGGVDACDPLANVCSYSRAWPSLAFTETSVNRTATDALGRKTRLLLSGGHLIGIGRPTTPVGQNDTITWNVDDPNSPKVTTYSNGAGTWTYAYALPPPGDETYTLTNTVTDPLGHAAQIAVNTWNPTGTPGQTRSRVVSVADPLGLTTQYGYDNEGRLWFVTAPEGDRTAYGYTAQGNPTSWSHTPKPGSGLSAVSIAATYGDCSTPIRCGLPMAVTDQRGNVTDYTYDAAGNLLTVTGPAATPGAPRPQTRYVWEQRYAWYKQNGSSAITQAASPVWVQVSQSQCLTGATCP